MHAEATTHLNVSALMPKPSLFEDNSLTNSEHWRINLASRRCHDLSTHLSTDLSAICSEEIVFQKFKEAFEEGIRTFKEPSFLWFFVINKSNPDAKDDHWMVWRNQHFSVLHPTSPDQGASAAFLLYFDNQKNDAIAIQWILPLKRKLLKFKIVVDKSWQVVHFQVWQVCFFIDIPRQMCLMLNTNVCCNYFW